VQFGLVTDRKLCADPQRIIDRFAPEFEQLLYAVLLMPWEERADPDLAERALNATEALAGAARHLSERADVAEANGHGASPESAPQTAAPLRPGRRRSAFAAARASGVQ
jgi:hypothetical protein